MRLATAQDIPTIVSIFNDAKASLAAAGVNQWQYGYPNSSSVEKDIVEGVGYVYPDEGAPLAYMALRPGKEAAYRQIFEGAWLTDHDAPYATIHRIAVSASQKRQGLARLLFREAQAIAAAQGSRSLRVDTHPDNQPMQGLIGSLGFHYCGKIHLIDGPEDGNLRLCYELLLETPVFD